MLIGRLVGRDGQRVHRADVLVPILEAGTLLRVADDDIGVHQARQIKGLAGRHTGDEPVIVRHDLSQGRMAQAGADQVTVDLVGHHPEPVLFDDGRHAAQLLLGPDVAGGVVGIAEHQQLHVRVGGLRLKVLPVHGEVAVFLPQG